MIESWFGLLKYDALGSIAHAKMLGNIGLLSTETNSLVSANDIIADMKETLSLKIHLKMYTPKSVFNRQARRCWKKFHTARSCNDQVLVDVNLYLKDVVIEIKKPK
jgi:argininosuccinate lyase